MSSSSGGSVYSLTKHHEKRQRRDHLKKKKQTPEPIAEESEEPGEPLAQGRNQSAEVQELETLQMLTGCMSEISNKYDQMAHKFQ
jgi:hypothetical protein